MQADAFHHFIDIFREHCKLLISRFLYGNAKISICNLLRRICNPVNSLYDFSVNHTANRQKQYAKNQKHAKGHQKRLVSAFRIVFTGRQKCPDYFPVIFFCHIIAFYAAYNRFAFSRKILWKSSFHCGSSDQAGILMRQNLSAFYVNRIDITVLTKINIF